MSHCARTRPVAAWLVAALPVALAAPASAGLIEAAFVDGTIFRLANAWSPEFGLNTGQSFGTIDAHMASGGGQTSSGLVDAFSTMLAEIDRGSDMTIVRFQGMASVSQPEGYGGWGDMALGSNDDLGTPTPLVMQIFEPLLWSIDDQGDASVTIEPLGGGFAGDVLQPGLYALSFALSAEINPEQSYVETTMDWTLTLTPVPAPATLALLGLGVLGIRRRR